MAYKKKKIIIHEHDYWAWKQFRGELEKHLKYRCYDIVLICKKDSSTLKNCDHSKQKENIVIINTNTWWKSFFKELYYRNLFCSKCDIEIVIGVRTYFFYSILKFSRKKNLIVLLPGLGRSKNYHKLFWSYFNSKLSLVAEKVIVLNRSDEEKISQSADKVKVINSEGLEKMPRYLQNYDHKPNSFLYLGRLEKMKGVMTLSSIFAKQSRLKLDIFGFGEQKFVDFLCDLSNQHSSVNFLGRTDNSLEVMQNYEFLIAPSDYPEGFPIVIMEAISVGCIPLIKSTPENQHIWTHVPMLLPLPQNYTLRNIETIVESYREYGLGKLRAELFKYIQTYHQPDNLVNVIARDL